MEKSSIRSNKAQGEKQIRWRKSLREHPEESRDDLKLQMMKLFLNLHLCCLMIGETKEDRKEAVVSDFKEKKSNMKKVKTESPSGKQKRYEKKKKKHLLCGWSTCCSVEEQSEQLENISFIEERIITGCSNVNGSGNTTKVRQQSACLK
ncbi:hypothetical protein OJAV_G00075260 [Oryzias javanicus]|uniref:Uncharacterized protein n=1 Tax=Oryzias javanicus TaxID=123683 RepID=A0A3S2MXQ9_ORYJA|nr:hypothetical protein OJAV_G00075260 [Oryzias javanicus]